MTYRSFDVEPEGVEKIKPLVAEIAKQAARIAELEVRIVELEAALESCLIAYDSISDDTDGDAIVDRLEAIEEGERWYSGEDLQSWAADKARLVLAKGKTS